MSEMKPVAALETLARYEPDTRYIGTGEYVAECVPTEGGDYYLVADVVATVESLLKAMEEREQRVVAELREKFDEQVQITARIANENASNRLRAERAEALLRQALERLESVVEHFDPYMGDNECRPMENARYTIAALRDRLWKKI